MIPQYIAVKTAKIGWDTLYLIGVMDEDYKFNHIGSAQGKAWARVLASNAATEYRVPIAEQAERLLGM